MTAPSMLTVATGSELDQVEVLRRSLSETHPDWRAVLVLDEPDAVGSLSPPFDEVLPAHEIVAEDGWDGAAQLDAEARLVALGVAGSAHLLARPGWDSPVVHIGHDRLVLGDLSPLVPGPDESLVLVPRALLADAAEPTAVDDELEVLRTGTFDTGLHGWSPTPDARRVAEWYASRLEIASALPDALDELDARRLLDLVPTLFPGVRVLADPGLGVSGSRAAARRIGLDSAGEYVVHGTHPVRVMQFADPDGSGPREPARRAPENLHVVELWRHYLDRLDRVRELP